MALRAAPLPHREFDDESAPLTLRYVERFRCIGAACEANCCRGDWSIPVDAKHYDKLKGAMSASRAGRDAFRASVRLDPRGVGPGRHALLVLDEHGACKLLDDDGLCSVHRRYGDTPLPDTCALYPRMLARIGSRVEMTASVSCPEVARLLLCEEDGAELVPLDRAHLPQRDFAVRVDLNASPYARYADDVRDAVLRLLSLPDFPVATRLFFVTLLGHRTAPFFQAGATRDAGPQLAAEIVRLERPEVLAELASQYHEVAIPPGLAEEVALEVMRARLVIAQPDFRTLVARAAASYGHLGDEGQAVDGAALCAAYRARADALPRWAAQRIDGYLTRYAINHWMRRIYLFSATLLLHAQELSLWIAMLRLLLLGQPGARSALESGDEVERLRGLDAAAVEVFFRFARAMEHAPDFRVAMNQRLDELGLRTFAHAVALTKM